MKGIYLVSGHCRHLNLDTVVTQAVKARICCVQLREKDCDTRTFLNRAIRLKTILQGSGIPLIINDRIDIALAAGADGVNIGQSDMSFDRADEQVNKKNKDHTLYEETRS